MMTATLIIVVAGILIAVYACLNMAGRVDERVSSEWVRQQTYRDGQR